MTMSSAPRWGQLLFHHFEKIALGACAVLLLAAAARPLLARPAELELRETVAALDEKVETHLSSYSASVPPI
jgi:hypothetical protein